MRSRGGRHTQGYTKIDVKANEENAYSYCHTPQHCKCQTCLSCAHSDGKALVHCYQHGNGCHLSCEV